MDIALFSPSTLFEAEGDDDVETGESHERVQQHNYLERSHAFPGGSDILIREFSFHQHNANLLWPGTFVFSEWLLQNHSLLHGQRILELGSGTGALAIFLRKTFAVDITTSDFDDKEIEENIAHNCKVNGLNILPHIRHTWGNTFATHPVWDMIIASDILLYVKQYTNLIKTLCLLLKTYRPMENRDVKKILTAISGKEVQLRWPIFLMSWRRRIGKEEEGLFFSGCEEAGLSVEHLGSRIYLISNHPQKGRGEYLQLK